MDLRPALANATTRSLALLIGVVGVGIAALLPTLFTAAAAGPNAGVAVLTLAVAGLLALTMHQGVAAAGAETVAAESADSPPPTLPGRVTDPTHHPVRPRAPGRV